MKPFEADPIESKDSPKEDFRDQSLKQLIKREVLEAVETLTNVSGEYIEISLDGNPYQLRFDKTNRMIYVGKNPKVAKVSKRGRATFGKKDMESYSEFS